MTIPNYEGELYDSIVRLGLLSTKEKQCLDAAPGGPGGGYTFCCPSCSARMSVFPGVVECVGCGFISWGEWADVVAEMGERAAERLAGDSEEEKADRAREYDHAARPVAPIPIFTLASYTISTPGNISVLQAKMKAGKSAAVGGMLSAPMAAPGADCLWFGSSNERGRALLHFDTEQSLYDHHNSIWRSIKRAGVDAPPKWFKSYHLKGLNIKDSKAMIERRVSRGAAQFGGVHSIMIDGIADLCADVNDSAESVALVAWCEEMATKYACAVWCVLHENHSSSDGKTRGHLGSQLARKAETNLRLEKDANGVTLMWADTSRSVYIPKKNALGFSWNDDRNRHERVETTGAAAVISKKQREYCLLAVQLAELCGGTETTYSALRAAVIQAMNCAPRWAEKQIGAMVKFGTLCKQNDSYKIVLPSTVR